VGTAACGVKKRKVSIRANGNLSKPIITCRHAHSGLNYELPISGHFFIYANFILKMFSFLAISYAKIWGFAAG
jgi:hypothetical protein